MSSRAKMVKDCTKRRQKSLRVTRRFEPWQATFALTRRPVRVLTAVMEIATLAVLYTRHHLTFGCPIAFEFVGDHHPWHVRQSFEEMMKKRLGCLLMPPTLHESVESVVILIHRPPQVMPLAVDGQKDRVEMSFVAGAWPTST